MGISPRRAGSAICAGQGGEINREILRAEGGGLTHLRYAANLIYAQLKRYLVFIEGSGIVVLERRGSQIEGSKTTERGRAALKLMEELSFVPFWINIWPAPRNHCKKEKE